MGVMSSVSPEATRSPLAPGQHTNHQRYLGNVVFQFQPGNSAILLRFDSLRLT
jgi:hypothetical protein